MAIPSVGAVMGRGKPHSIPHRGHRAYPEFTSGHGKMSTEPNGIVHLQGYQQFCWQRLNAGSPWTLSVTSSYSLRFLA